MEKGRVRLGIIILAVLSLISGIFFKIKLIDFDQAVISYGLKTARFYQIIGNTLVGIAALAVVGLVILQVVSKAKVGREQKASNRAKKTDPTHDEGLIVAKLTTLINENTSYEQDLSEARNTIIQINDCIDDLKSLQVDNDYELLDKISYSMLQAKVQILQNVRSIMNRVTVEGDPQEIQKRLDNSSKILKEVRGLLNEAVNYLDSKSPSTKADLESMTAALKTLNQTIE